MMLRRTPWLSDKDVDRALQALTSAKTREEVRRCIATEAVFTDPEFHVALRERSHERLQVDPNDPLKQRRDDLFLLLHEDLHRQSAVEAPLAESASQEARAVWVKDMAPRFFIEAQKALNGAIPPEVATPLCPLDAPHAPELNGQALPRYQPTAGTRWNIVVVRCPRCERQWTVVHAFLVDFLVEDLRRSWSWIAEEEARCTSCGCTVSVPLFVWMQEEPCPTDALNAFGLVVRVTPSLIIYRPAHGPSRGDRTDRIFEMRASRMEEETGADAMWIASAGMGAEPQNAASSPGPRHDTTGGETGEDELRYLAVAYSDLDAEGIVRDKEPDAPVPFAMGAFLSDVAQKMKTGVFPLSHVELSLRGEEVRLGADWPVTINPLTFSREPHRFLAEALVAEEIARRRGSDPDLRATLADQTGRAFLLLGEAAAAEIALCRAEELLEEIPVGSSRGAVVSTLRETRAGLYVKLGKHGAAAELRSLNVRGTVRSFLDEVKRSQTRCSMALNLFRSDQVTDGFALFRTELPVLEALVDHAKASTVPEERGFLPSLQRSLSGALANFGTLLAEIASFMELMALASAIKATDVGPPDTRYQNALKQRSMDLIAELGLSHAKMKAFEGALSGLADYFGSLDIPESEWHAGTLRKLARELLERAIPISETIGDWTFAARQSQHLSGLAELANDADGAERTMRRALQHAARIDDHSVLIHGNLFFAHRLGRAGDGAGALSHVRAAAREAVRQVIGFGRHDRGRGTAEEVGWLALQCARFGADPLEAIVIAESTKAVPLTMSLSQPVVLPDADAWRRDANYVRWCDATGIDIDEPRKLVERLQSLGRAAYIGYLPGADRVWVYAIWEDRAIVEWARWPEDADVLTLRDSSDQLREEALRAWADLLLKPIRKALETLTPEDRLVVSIHEALAHVPFAALPLDEQRLCQKAQLSYVEGSGLFSARSGRQVRFQAALCIGAPHRPERHDLPSAEAEAATIAELFRARGAHARVLTGRDATIAAIREAAPTADVLHFACHAEPPRVGSDGGLPALLLTPDAEVDTGELSDELVLRDIALKQDCFVSLAACESAVHAEAVGPSVRGLVPAFLVRGAAGVLASQWKILSAPARQFSEELYGCLLSGMGPAAALVHVQRAFLAGEHGEEWRAPEHWAGYVLYGTGR